MRRVFGKKFRAAVLTLVFSVTLVPVAAAAPSRDQGTPSLRDGFVRIVRVIKKKLSLVTNIDSLVVPRP